MSGSGEATLPPGWYPDPDGAAGLVRWWDGGGWSDVTIPAGPGVTVQRAPAAAPPRPPAAPPAAAPARRFPTAWVVVLSVLGLVVVLVVGLLVGRSGGDGDTGAAANSGTPAPSGPTFPSGTVRIFDEQAGISYPWLGENWQQWNLGPQREVTRIAGQYLTTQEHIPGPGKFIAQCTSGPVAAGFGWGGPATLQSTLATLADSVRSNYYPAPNERKVLRDENRTVDGAAAHLYEFDLSWHVPGYDSTGERAALLLIDVGRPAPALLFLSIPNTHAELYGAIDQVLAGVRVL